MANFFVEVLKDLGYVSGCPSKPVRPIFKVKQAPKRAYPPFQRFSCAIENHFLSDTDSMSQMPKIFVDVRQDLGYAVVGPHSKSDPFSNSNES